MVVEDLGLLFLTVLMSSLLLTPVSISFSHWIGAIDKPCGRSVHAKPMPRMGGLGMALAMLAGLFLFSELDALTLAFVLGVSIVALTGVVDDVFRISPLWKLLGQVLASVVFVELSGLTVQSIGDVFGLGAIHFSGVVAYAVTLFLMVGTVNAFNLSDGLDGLAAGVVVIVCVFLAFLALTVQAWGALMLSIALLAAALGFLKFNSHPAKLFMGDTGSLMLGFSVAAVSIAIATFEPQVICPVTVVIVLALPVVDTLWVMSRRMLKGGSPVAPDKTHLHHRMLALGLPHSAVVTLLYAGVIAFGFLAILIRNLPEVWQLASALSLTALLYGVLSLCEHQGVCAKMFVKVHVEDGDAVGRVVQVLGKSMRFLPYLILLGLFVPLLMAESIPGVFSHLALGLAFFVAIAFPWREHQERLSVVYGLFYLCGFALLYVWSVASYQHFDLTWYAFGFSIVLLVWSLLKIKFKRHSEVLLTSNFELLLIFISWFVPYEVLPAMQVPESVLAAAKLACFGSIPLLIAMKLVIKRQSHRNAKMALSLILLLLFVAVRAA